MGGIGPIGPTGPAGPANDETNPPIIGAYLDEIRELITGEELRSASDERLYAAIERVCEDPNIREAVGDALSAALLVDGRTEQQPAPCRPPLADGERYYDVVLTRDATESVTIVVAAPNADEAGIRAEAIVGTYGENCYEWELDSNAHKVYVADTPTVIEEQAAPVPQA